VLPEKGVPCRGDVWIAQLDWKRVSQARGHVSKVKVTCVQMCKCNDGGGIHFDGSTVYTVVMFIVVIAATMITHA